MRQRLQSTDAYILMRFDGDSRPYRPRPHTAEARLELKRLIDRDSQALVGNGWDSLEALETLYQLFTYQGTKS